VVLLAAGHARESLQQSRLNVAAESGRAENHYNLGNALAALNETEKAVASYRQALQLDPSFSRAHNNLGVLELRRGNWREARASFEEALRHRPGYAEALRNLEAITGR
jgi:tetratricopeptide (TPR) repeat protein